MIMSVLPLRCSFFLFNGTTTTEIYTLSLHDALPISFNGRPLCWYSRNGIVGPQFCEPGGNGFLRSFTGGLLTDRKSTRLNSSHRCISYAAFCLKKKKRNATLQQLHTHGSAKLRTSYT